MKREGIRKAVAGILAFIVGISIAIVTIVPLLIYLNSTSGAMLKALNQVRDFQSQKSSESLEVVYEGGSIYLKNTGTIPATIVLSIIDGGGGCTNNTFLLKTNLTINTGYRITSINTTSNSYELPRICYVMTARGNVFPVKEKYNAILSQLTLPANATNIINPDNTIFAQDMIPWNQSGRIKINYSIDSYNCNTQATPDITYIPPYPRQVITLKENNQLKEFQLNNRDKALICFQFNDILNLTQQGYAVLVFLRLVVVESSTNRNNLRLDISLNGSIFNNLNFYSSSLTFISWHPSTDSDYLIWDVIMLIPLKQGTNLASPGVYSIKIDVLLDQINGRGAYYVGIEYLSIQGMKLVI